MRTARTLRLATLLAVMLVPDPSRARADVAPSLSAVDTPAELDGQDLPNSTAAFDAFRAAAAPLGTLVTTNLGTATQTLTPTTLGDVVTIAPTDGLTVTLAKVMADPTSLVASGVASTNPNMADGFNVTSTAGSFLRLTPDATNPAVTTSTASFAFARPVDAFGVYLMGLGTAPGTFQMSVYVAGQTAPTTYQLSNVTASNVITPGGSQYLDLVEPGASITGIVFQMSGFTTTSRDIVSFDGISFVNTTAIPEPSPAVLLTIGGSMILGARSVVRDRARARGRAGREGDGLGRVGR